ncbi:MAG: helix-turn-helix domain-containing protein [Flavobacteriaceae bacterium]|nr:helix-turn-helix domain-containing protein [Flavobacteriaceae bacterium]
MAYTLMGPYDVLSAAGYCSQQVASDKPPIVINISIVGINKGILMCHNGIKIECQKGLDDVNQTDLIIIPSMKLLRGPFFKKYPQLKEWITGHHKKGAVIASICVGSFLLAETGLLDGKIATTHWAFADSMAEQFPQIAIHNNNIITEQDNIICAGGGTSWEDLVMYLLEKYSTVDTANYVGQLFLLKPHLQGQKPYKQLKSVVTHEDLTIKESQCWIEKHLSETDVLFTTTENSGLHERTFKRRFKKATKQSPNEYIQNYRIDAAKNLLLTTGCTIKKISERVGLNDGSYFRRLFKRKTGMTAQNFRQEFSTYHQEKTVLRIS